MSEGERVSYDQLVKSSVIEALEKGNSVLQEPREGIDYSLNAASGSVYAGLNQFFLQQKRKDSGWKNPYFMTAQQVFAKQMGFVPNSHGTIITYWADPKRYHSNYTDASGIEHKKGDLMLDASGKETKGYEYNYVFNMAQIDPTQKVRRNNETRTASNAFSINTNIELTKPFQVDAGVAYRAKDSTIIERFAEDVSKYLNSIYTGHRFEGVAYSAQDVAELKAEFALPRSRFYEKVNDAGMIAAGMTEKLERIQRAREQRAQGQERSHSR